MTRVADLRPFKILAIDGGGIRGLIPARVLAELESRTNARRRGAGREECPIGLAFDLVAGTSTGGIIAAGLVGSRAERPSSCLATTGELVDFYRKDATAVFGRAARRAGYGLLGAKFGDGPLSAKLAQICGEARLSASLRPLLIPAYDTGKRRTRIFRGGEAYRHSDSDYRLKDVLRATTAAPSVFPPVRIAPIGRVHQETLIDGGIYANNPSLLARAEAQRLASERALLLVSVGTGQDTTPYGYHRIRRWGYSGWLNPWRRIPLLQLVMASQSEFTHQFLAREEADPRRYVRLNLSLPAGTAIAMDDPSPANLRRIEALADQIIEHETAHLDALAELLAQD